LAKRKKRKKKRRIEEGEKELILPTEGQVICVVSEIIGADHVKAICTDGVTRVCRIPGKMRKRVWIKLGDVILVGIWDFQPNKGDVLHKYDKSNAQKLIKMGHLPKELLEGVLI